MDSKVMVPVELMSECRDKLLEANRNGYINAHPVLAKINDAIAAAPKADREQGEGTCKEADGCPTERAVLQRFWREMHQSKAEQPQAQDAKAQVLMIEVEVPEGKIIDGIQIGLNNAQGASVRHTHREYAVYRIRSMTEQRDVEYAAMFRWLRERDNFPCDEGDGPSLWDQLCELEGDEFDQFIRAAMKRTGAALSAPAQAQDERESTEEELAWIEFKTIYGEDAQRHPNADWRGFRRGWQARAALAQKPEASIEQFETGWLIENGKNQGDGLAYRYIDNDSGGIPGWTEDHNKALRFARRADAEQFAHHDEDAWRIAEHAWHIDAAQPADKEGKAEQHSDDMNDAVLRGIVLASQGEAGDMLSEMDVLKDEQQAEPALCAWLERAARSGIAEVEHAARTMMAFYQGAEFPEPPAQQLSDAEIQTRLEEMIGCALHINTIPRIRALLAKGK